MHTWTLGVGCAQVCISLRASCRMDEWVRAPGARALGSLQGVCRLQACTQSCTGISMYIHTCICSLAAIQIKGTAMRIIIISTTNLNAAIPIPPRKRYSYSPGKKPEKNNVKYVAGCVAIANFVRFRWRNGHHEAMRRVTLSFLPGRFHCCSTAVPLRAPRLPETKRMRAHPPLYCHRVPVPVAVLGRSL